MYSMCTDHLLLIQKSYTVNIIVQYLCCVSMHFIITLDECENVRHAYNLCGMEVFSIIVELELVLLRIFKGS